MNHNKMAHASELNTILSSALNISMISTVQSTPLYQNEEFLREAYLEKRLSIRQIADEICSARETIKQALRRFGIELKPVDEIRRLNSGQVAYGEKVVHNRKTQSMGESKVLSQIVAMRSSGSSYGAITDWLNANGYLTKNRVNGWSRASVYKIVKRSLISNELKL